MSAESRYEMYSKAKERLERPGGWVQGSYGTTQTPNCLVGALNIARNRTYIGVASGELPDVVIDEIQDTIVQLFFQKKTLFGRTVSTLPESLTNFKGIVNMYHNGFIERWNDNTDTTKDQVIDVLATLAKKYENDALREKIAELEAQKAALEARVATLREQNKNLLTRLAAKRYDEDQATLDRLDKELEAAYAALV